MRSSKKEAGAPSPPGLTKSQSIHEQRQSAQLAIKNAKLLRRLQEREMVTLSISKGYSFLPSDLEREETLAELL